jgi:hypothetical protein
MIGIDEQLRDMAERLPAWWSDRIDLRTAAWTGTLTPHRTCYRIRIEYTAPLVVEDRPLLWIQPLVEVLSPSLRYRFFNPEGSLPHVYPSHPRTPRSGPFLCLFDDERQEWTPDDHLSETTVPWAANWLSCYETWLATGYWLGSGRHIPPDPDRIDQIIPFRRQLLGSTADTSITRNFAAAA